jgi:hypothetical protein
MIGQPRTASRLVPTALRPAARRAYYGAMPPSARRSRIAAHLRGEAGSCAHGGSPLYARLLRAAADDVEARGACWQVLSRRPLGAAAYEGLAMRLMAGVHRIVLSGGAPELAAYYPSVGGTRGDDPWPAFEATVRANQDRLVAELGRPVQTNEVGRCATLVGGFLLVARETRLPLRLLEVGASAGLNLRWPEYHYRHGELGWGDPGSPVQIEGAYAGGFPPFETTVEIADRRGCDAAPLDPASEDDRLTLMSFLWADQRRRFELQRGALEVARQVPAPVDRADAADWLEPQLATAVPGAATVVFHSIVMPYLPDAARTRFRRTLVRAAARATDQAPLAWLRLEWGEGDARLDLTTWPGGTSRLLARADNLGWNVRWLL